MSKTVIFFFMIMALVIIGIWYLYYETTAPQQPISMQTLITPLERETSQIERQIEQVKVEQNPPEIINLNAMVSAFESDPMRWDIVIAVGDIYRRGAYPRFLPNEQMALRCYKIASMCPDGQIAGMGQSKYIETYDDPIKDIDKAGKNLPTNPGTMICDIAEDAIKNTPWHLFEKPKQIQKNKVIEPVAYDFLEDDMWAMNMQTQTQTQTRDIEIPVYRRDSQNVHDHGVTKVTAFNIKKLKENVNINTLNSEEVKNAILQSKDLDIKTKEDALHVIDKLNDSQNSSLNTTERESLGIVWNNIKSKDSTLRDNLTETLGKQLASSIEYGHVVCSSGKITRIMSTLDGTDETETTRPMWALREEMANTAANIRDKVTKQYGDTPEAGRLMREKFANLVKKEYVEKLGMSENIIAPLIEEYNTGF